MTLGQNVNIPDANFKAYLVGNTAINTNGDTEQVSEASAFNGTIYCFNMSISDLTGIEAFTALKTLWCGENQLTSLNVSDNTDLNDLDCHNNLLTNLDLSGATALTHLSCNDNQLTNLYLSNNTDLETLLCWNNQLTSLDVSNHFPLEFLSCSDNQLTSLDIRYMNYMDMYLLANNNPNLYCIDVDDVTLPTVNWTVANQNIDPQHYFSTNCSGTAIEEHTSNKELLRTIDVLGRETTNQPLFYIFDDGTVEKRITVE
jgi:Leucine-rich repeat (LRR) protein